VISQAHDEGSSNTMRTILALSLLVVALAISGLYALFGTGGLIVFGLGKSLGDTYYLITPFLSLLILLTCLFSIRWMAALFLIHFVILWVFGMVANWPSINPIRSSLDMWPVSIALLAWTGYLLFPAQLRSYSVLMSLRGIGEN
jgi:hypothetical protein